MQQSQTHHNSSLPLKKKLTLTELKRFLPLPSPQCSNSFPPVISQYLLSTQFSNLSITEQKVIEQKYKIVYRNYFGIEDIVNYLNKLTRAKYTTNSIRRAICNSAERYGVVDWYKIVRTVMKDSNNEKKSQTIFSYSLSQNQEQKNTSQEQQKKSQVGKVVLINKIKQLFSSYQKKKVIWKGVEEVAQTKKNLEEKILKQLIKEAVNEVKEHIEKNRIACEKILYQYQEMYTKINFIICQRLLNKDFELYMDRKKCIYFYLHFDQNNKGYFASNILLSELLVVHKPKPPKIEPQYMTDPQQIFQRMRSEFNILFDTAADLKKQFSLFYNKKFGNQITDVSSLPQTQLSSKDLYEFISLHLNNRYSNYQSDLVLKKIQYVGNIQFLYNKPKPLQLASFFQKFAMKNNSARKKLKAQNQVFYSYRKIILNLISKAKQKKITRQKFTEFVTGIDPKLCYNSFYCIWRVYPSIINIERMIEKSQLNKFACYLKLRKSEDEYFQLYQDLIDQYPEGTMVMYDKVEQKINLTLQFLLENSKIKLEKYSRFDQVDYRKTIDEIIQPDFEIMLRKYIFTKVSEKAYGLWKARKKRMQALKIVEHLKKMMIASDSKKSLDSKKMSPNKSKSSIRTRKSNQPKYDPESLEIVKWNLDKLLIQLQTSEKYLHKQFHKDKNYRFYLCVNNFEKYVYRTVKPRFCISNIVGIIALSQELLFLKNNKIQNIKAKFLYKPGIEIIDFTNNEANDIIVLTSYFTLEFYNLSQRSNYSYKSIELLDQVQCVTNSMLDQICEDRVYSKFPIFIRAYNNLIVVNTTVSNNRICIINNETDRKLNQIIIRQREHVFTAISQRIFLILKKHPKCNQIVTEMIHHISSTHSLTANSVKQIFQHYYKEQSQDYIECEANDELRKFTIKQLKQFGNNLVKYTPYSLNCLLLKQQFGMLTPRKMPESLIEVLESIKSQMQMRNTSLLDMLIIIDREQEGIVKMKAFKDYLLKITQQVYLYNEKQIDQYLKDMCIGKNVPYEAICEILIQWSYKIWERPRLVVRDFIYEQQAELLIYTVEGQIDVFIRNVKDHSIVGILREHSKIPQITYIPESMLLITGDDKKIRVWRLFEDFINKYDQNPPWEINCVYELSNAHENLITSISYLPRAHCLVTTSLDSTAKFWKIVTLFQEEDNTNGTEINRKKHSLQFKQQHRIYSEQHYFLQGKPNFIAITQGQQNSKGVVCYESISLSKISKQINQNNRYKFQHTIQSYHIERIKLETGNQNIYIDKIPQKLTNEIMDYNNKILAKKKTILLQKWVKEKQQSIQKINLVTYSLQRGLYQAVKKYYIFKNPKQLYRLASFLNKKNDKGFMIYKVLFEEYGLRVIEKKQKAPPIIGENQVQLVNNLKQTNFQAITLPDPQKKAIFKRLKLDKDINSSQFIKYTELKKIVQQYLYGSQFEKFQQLIEKYYLLNSQLKQNGLIKMKDVKSLFLGYSLESPIDKFYCLLRGLKVNLKQNNKKIWELFVENKRDLQKRTKISSKQFNNKLINLGFQQENIKLILSFLAKNEEISFQQLIYFIKIAQEAVSLDLKNSNFSNVFLNNSRVLQTRLNQYQEEQNPLKIKQQDLMEEKLMKFEQSNGGESGKIIRDSEKKPESSRKSSAKRIVLTPALSDAESAGERSASKHASRQKSQKKREQVELRSYHISSSGSRLSLSKSDTKDIITKQAIVIISKIKELLKNQQKSLWDIVSLTIPDFMENQFISQTEYFGIFKALNSPVYLFDKIKLLNYIMRQAGNYAAVNLNILFELFEISHFHQKKSKVPPTLPGEKYLFNHIISKLTENKMKLEHSITANFFKEKQELSIEELLNILSQDPFSMLNFCLRQMQLIFVTQNKLAFVTEQVFALIMQKIEKYHIKIQIQQIGYIDELNYRIQNRNQSIEDLLPKQFTSQNNGKVNYYIFRKMIKQFFNQKQIILQNEFIKLITKNDEIQKQKQKLTDSPNKLRSSPTKKLTKVNLIPSTSLSHAQMIKSSQLKYKNFISTVQILLEELKKSNNSSKDTLRKFIKCLEAKKINLLTFFLSLDPNRNYYINQMQLVAGLAQLKINDNFWSSIKKKNVKKLYYNQLILYLIEKGAVDYKCVDSELEAAMSKFLRRFMRNDDVQVVYDRIRDKGKDNSTNVSFQSFNKAVKTGNLFKQQEIFYIFSAFVNAENLKQSKFSNDDLIKDPTNTLKQFNFKMFTDVINTYRNQNISKTPLYKLGEWLRKRNISFLNELIKWMQRNKKIKQVGQALKNKEKALPKTIFSLFIKDFNSGLSDKEIKEIMSGFRQNVDFSTFNQRLDQIYRKGNSNIAAQEVNNYLQIMYKHIQKSKVSIERLYKDFSSIQGAMKISDFSDVINFLEMGLTKIQIRQIFESIDIEKKSYISLTQLQESLEQAAQSLQKKQQDLELENILEKIIRGKEKFSLKASRLSFSLQRASIIFQKILTAEETEILYHQAQEHLKTVELTETSMEEYIKIKQKEARAKKDKKYKQLTMKFLNFLKKVNLQVPQIYFYFSKDTNSLPKNKFLILYQSLQLKSNIVEINALYSYLDQNKSGLITLTKWEDKFNMIMFESQNQIDQQGKSSKGDQQLQVFYKVKLLLSQIYLIFIQKLFKSKQIYAYFDLKGNGFIDSQSFISSIVSLGISIDENMEKRLINYLDRQKNGQIAISRIVNQLQNCMTSKSKLILQTKTACIFKSKVHLIQQKQQYFIQRLVKLENFSQIKGKINSCILTTQLIAMIRDFGIILGQDQLNDIQRNFSLQKDNLSLYPLYFMFVNIFKSAQFNYSSEDMQKQRFNKLFKTMVKNNITMKIFDKIQTITQASNFLTQLKIFTPIEVKLIIESVTLTNTNLIDKKLLAYKLRNSYLSNKTADISNSQYFDTTGNLNISKQEKLRRHLKALINPSQITAVLKATSGKISQPTFVSLLNKLQLVFTQNQAHQFFSAFSMKKQYIMLENLLSRDSSAEELSISQSLVNPQKSFNRILISDHEKQLQQNQEYEQYLTVLLNHIAKQLDFKGVSLEQAWEKYFENYGYITFEFFQVFLAEIGFDYSVDPYKRVVEQLLKKIYAQTSQKQIKRSYFEDLMRSKSQYPSKSSKINKYNLQLSIFQQFINYLIQHNLLNDFVEQLQNFINQQTGRSQIITLNQFYSFLQSYYATFRKRKITGLQKKYLKFIATNFMNLHEQETDILICQIKDKIVKHYNKKHLMQSDENQQIFVKDPSASLFQTKQALQQMVKNLQLIRVCEHNFIWNYEQEIQKLQNIIVNFCIPIENLPRISSTLLCEQLLLNPYLLKINPTFQPSQKQSTIQSPLQIKKQNQIKMNKISNLQSYSSKSIQLSTLNNLIIDSEQLIQNKGVYLVNNKYNGILISASSSTQAQKVFENLHHATKLLQPDFKFYRAKNYYLWDPISKKMPKMSINYRWRLIPEFIVRIAKQFSKLGSQGFSVPHFTWQGLSRNGLQQLGFVAKTDTAGHYYEDVPFKSLLSIQNPYSAPQLFMNIESKLPQKQKNNIKLTTKIDSWIFGCLIYQFIWGHPPQSFILQLFKYIKDRGANLELSDALKISELPSDFHYNPFDFIKIGQVLSLQHELRAARGQSQDLEANITYFGYRGLIKRLQIIYGDQLMYYRDDIMLFQQIMKTIQDCLNPHQELRLDFYDIIQQYQPLVGKKENFSQYLDVLDNHQRISGIYEDILEPLLSEYQKAKKNYHKNRNIGSLVKISSKLLEKTKQCLSSHKIDIRYVIPKAYPWPYIDEQQNLENPNSPIKNKAYQKSINKSSPIKQNTSAIKLYQGHTISPLNMNMTHSRHFKTSQNFGKQLEQQVKPNQYAKAMLKNKQHIRANSAYNVMAFLNNQQILEMLVNLCIKIDKNEPKREQIIERVFDLLLRMVQSIKDYTSMLVGYIPNLLQAIIQLIFDRQFSFVLNPQDKSKQTQKKSLKCLELTKCKQKCIKKLERIIYVNGTGNVQYLPLKQFLEVNHKFRKLFEYFYSAIKLDSPEQYQQYLSINYFISEIENSSEQPEQEQSIIWQVLQYFRIDTTILKILTKISTSADDTQHLKSVLIFILSLSSKISDTQQDAVSIFTTQVFYVQLHRFLSLKAVYTESLTIKSLIVDILANIIRNLEYSPKILKLLLSPSYSIIKEILKMLIEPGQKFSEEKSSPTKTVNNISRIGLNNSSLYMSKLNFEQMDTGNKTAQYEQYLTLIPVLSTFISTLKQSPFYMKKIREIEGAQFILEAFERKIKQFQ